MHPILIPVDENYEDLELWYPKLRLQEAGFEVVVAGPVKGGVSKGKHGYPCKADIAFGEIKPEQYGGIVIPGGFAPDRLRRVPQVLAAVQDCDRRGALIAFICHGGWVPISAKILKGRRVTGTVAIKDDLENAGGIWEDAETVIDHHLISSRTPIDLPAFASALVSFLIGQ